MSIKPQVSHTTVTILDPRQTRAYDKAKKEQAVDLANGGTPAPKNRKKKGK